MAAHGDPLAAHQVPRLPRPGARPVANTLPELERRLLVNRNAVVDTVEQLRQRMRQDVRQLNPVVQAQRHPEAALGIAAVAGLVAGRVLGGVAAALVRSR